MKNALLALALFAFVGSATANEGPNDAKGKKSKKATASLTKANCTPGEKSAAGGSCCAKKGAKTAAVTPTPAAAPAVKSM